MSGGRSASERPGATDESGSPAREVARTLDGTLRTFGAEALLLPAGLVTAVYLSRKLGADGYGLFTVAVTLVTWVRYTISSMMSRTTIKCVSESEDWRPVGTTALRTYLVLGLATAALVAVGSGPLARLLGHPRLAPYLAILAVEVLLQALISAHRDVLIGVGGFRDRAMASAIRAPVRVALIVLLVEAGLSITGAVLASVATAAIELGFYRAKVRPALLGARTFPLRRLLNLAAPIFVFGASMRLFGNVDLFAVSALGGTADQTGYYGAARNLSVVPSLFALSFVPLLLSTLGRLLRKDERAAARRLATDSLRIVAWMLPFAAMTAGASDEIVRLVYGDPFAPAAPLLGLLIFGSVLILMITVATAVMVAADRPRLTAFIAAPMVAAALVGHLWAVPRFGPVGAAGVTASFALAGATVSLVATHRLWRIAVPGATLLRTGAVSALAWAIAAGWGTAGGWVVLKIAVVFLVVPAALVATGEIGARELRFARRVAGFAPGEEGTAP